MACFDIGNYSYSATPGLYSIKYGQADRDDQIIYYDRMLYQSIKRIFRERCLGYRGQIKVFLCGPRSNTNQRYIMKPIMKQESILSEHFSKKELENLSLLWIAVLGGYQQSAELLVLSGADVNKSFGRHNPQIIDEKWNVLHVLLQMRPSQENERLIRLIVDHDANLQARDCKGKTVLHYAVMEGRVQMTKMLLEKGADINIADDDGVTPLLETVWNSKVNELVLLLVKHGADVFVKCKDGQNILHRLGRIEPRIHTAVVARLLIKKGVSLHDKSKDYQLQPLHLAAMNKNVELVNVFLDHGADVNAQIYDGMFPLYFAVTKENNAAVVETLLKRGANVNQKWIRRDRLWGNTALHFACASFYEEYIRLLLSAGADVIIENDYGRTPLSLILSSGNRRNSSSVRSIIEVLVLKKVCQPTIVLKDEKIIEQCPMLQKHYRDSIEQIERMKSTRFIETCTFFELFTKCQCQIAALMRNPNFETKFKLYDLSDLSTYYAEVITRAFVRAQNHYHSMLEQKEVISEAFYHSLPYVVVRRMAHYICNCCENVK